MNLCYSKLIQIAGACVLSACAGAEVFSLKGFGTLGLARSDQEGAEYVRDLSQPHGVTRSWSSRIDSVLGVQGDYRVNSELEGVAQVISRYRYDGSRRPELSWAFLRYEPNPHLDLRAGRLGTEFYMMADSRLVGYSNLTVRPPPEYFGSLVFSYLDGLDLASAWPLGGDTLLRGKVFAGKSPETSPFAGGATWDLSGSLLLGGHLDWLSGPWQIRLGHAQVRFEHELPLAALVGFDPLPLTPELSVADTWSRFDSLGVVLDQGALQLQLMLSRTRHESDSYEDSRAGYAIASYRLGPVSPYLGYSRVKSEAVSSSNPLTLQLSAATHMNQHTWFLGARWDVRPQVALKAQVDRIRGASDSIFTFRSDIPVWDGHMTVYSLALDFVF